MVLGLLYPFLVYLQPPLANGELVKRLEDVQALLLFTAAILVITLFALCNTQRVKSSFGYGSFFGGFCYLVAVSAGVEIIFQKSTLIILGSFLYCVLCRCF